MKRKKLDLTKFLDGTFYGRLKVSVFVYLNRKFPFAPPEDIESVDIEIQSLFQNAECIGMAKQWLSLSFEKKLEK